MKNARVVSLTLATIIFCGCSSSSSSAERDAKKVAEIYCKAQRLLKNAATGDMSTISESTKLSQAAAKTYRELEGKYTKPDDAEKFLRAYNNAIRNCD